MALLVSDLDPAMSATRSVVARLRRVLALRAMVASGMSQRQIAEALGVTQPALSQQLKYAPELDDVHPEVLLEAAVPVLARGSAALRDRRRPTGCPG